MSDSGSTEKAGLLLAIEATENIIRTNGMTAQELSRQTRRLGFFYSKAGAPDQAKGLYQEALQIDPENFLARKFLEALGD